MIYYSVADVFPLTSINAQQFIIHLKDKYSPQSLNAVIHSIRYFFDAVFEKSLSRRHFPNLLYHPKDTFVFSLHQISMLLKIKYVRLRAFILLGLDAGLRVEEAVRV